MSDERRGKSKPKKRKPTVDQLINRHLNEADQTSYALGIKDKLTKEFKDVLLEFATRCIVEQPRNVIDYAATYFTRLDERRHTERMMSSLRQLPAAISQAKLLEMLLPGQRLAEATAAAAAAAATEEGEMEECDGEESEEVAIHFSGV